MNMKDGKVKWIDEIPAKLLKNLGDYLLNLLYEIIPISYKTGAISEEFVKSRIISLLKKWTTMECSNYWTIFILPHALKILLEIIKEK